MPSPTFQNLGFEAAGPSAGLAAGWTLGFRAAVAELAGYGPGPARPEESFERGWLGNEAYVFAFERTALESAFFDESPEPVEDFAEGWRRNEFYLRELASVAAANYAPAPQIQPVERFEARWAGNEAFIFSFGAGNLSAAPAERFETGWRGNELFLFALGPGALDFGGAEDFEAGGWLLMTTM